MNALANATSPYLLQHKDNPVDWVEWSESAFEKARELGKPVFLSIGYSTCHWCHVMAHESFESEEIAKVMNDLYVCIKVDREERPDIDSTYMTFVQATTGSGGWPLSVWLTPDGLPIVGGTYFPPEDRGGRAGFPTILKEVAKAWKEDGEKMAAQGADLMKQLQEHALSTSAELSTSSSAVQKKLGQEALTTFDKQLGGYGEAPKFPRPAFLDAVLAHKDQEVRQTAVLTLEAMANGGIHDHLAGGFHRYSVDEFWHIPHYEKMLYDQGQLLISYTEAFRQSQSVTLKEAAYGIARYLLEDMRDSGGAFHAAEDADSYKTSESEKKDEGAYWTWTHHDLSQALDPKSAMIFGTYYGFKAEGNARSASDPMGKLTGTNTLYKAASLDDLTIQFNLSMEEIEQSIEESKGKLLELRYKRPHPHRDDKILTSWNALAIRGLGRAGFYFNEPKWITAAEEALTFLYENLWEDGQLFRTYRGSNSGIKAFPQDYVFLIAACLELDGVSTDEKWISWAKELQGQLDELFWSDTQRSYLVTTKLGDKELLSLAEDYDGAEPSPNNLAALNLQRLADRTLEMSYRKKAETLVKAKDALSENPSAMPLRAVALDEFENGVTHLRYSANLADERTRLVAEKLPTLSLLTKELGEDKFILCTDHVCQPSVNSLQDLKEKLELL